jgi:hypothetical protein
MIIKVFKVIGAVPGTLFIVITNFSYDTVGPAGRKLFAQMQESFTRCKDEIPQIDNGLGD